MRHTVQTVIMTVFMVLAAILPVNGAETRTIVLKGLLKPDNIAVDGDRIYITQNSVEVSIYSLNDLSFRKKFGKSGEGPGEFLRTAIVTPIKDRLLINSVGRISWFTREGELIESIKAQGGQAFFFQPLSDGFIGLGGAADDNGVYVAVNFYDAKLVKVNEIYRTKMAEKGFKKFDIFANSIPYLTHENRLYICRNKNFLVDCVDKNGKSFFKIEPKDYKNRVLTSDDEKIIRDFIAKQNPQGYEFLKANLSFPSHYPAVLIMMMDKLNNMLYIFTWKFSDGKYEVFKYTTEGKLVKTFQAPIQMQDALRPYPLNIYNNKLYHLVDNEETEEWELHITTLN